MVQVREKTIERIITVLRSIVGVDDYDQAEINLILLDLKEAKGGYGHGSGRT